MGKRNGARPIRSPCGIRIAATARKSSRPGAQSRRVPATRRERISPHEVGIRVHRPAAVLQGLRREEVAELALLVGDLVHLAGAGTAGAGLGPGPAGDRRCPAAGCPGTRLPVHAGRGGPARRRARDRGHPGVPACPLRQLEPFPAAVQNARWEILAFNRGYDGLTGLTRCRTRTGTPFCCTSPTRGGGGNGWEWEADAPRLVSQFRTAMAGHVTEPAWQELLELGCAVPLPSSTGRGPGARRRGFMSAPADFLGIRGLALLSLSRFNLWVNWLDGLLTIGYTPADGATAANFAACRRCRRWSNRRAAEHHPALHRAATTPVGPTSGLNRAKPG